MVPTQLFISAGGPSFLPRSSQQSVLCCQSWSIWPLTSVVDDSQINSGAQEVPTNLHKSRLHYTDAPLYFVHLQVPYVTLLDWIKLILRFPASSTNASLLKLNWPFRNVCKLPPFQDLSMMTFTSSLQVCLTMGAHIFFLDLINTRNLGQRLTKFAELFQKGWILALFNNSDALMYFL